MVCLAPQGSGEVGLDQHSRSRPIDTYWRWAKGHVDTEFHRGHTLPLSPCLFCVALWHSYSFSCPDKVSEPSLIPPFCYPPHSMDKLLISPQKPLDFCSLFCLPPSVPQAQPPGHHSCAISTISYTPASLQYNAYWITYTSLKWIQLFLWKVQLFLWKVQLFLLFYQPQAPTPGTKFWSCTRDLSIPQTHLVPLLMELSLPGMSMSLHSLESIHCIKQTPTYSWQTSHLLLLLYIAFHGPPRQD